MRKVAIILIGVSAISIIAVCKIWTQPHPVLLFKSVTCTNFAGIEVETVSVELRNLGTKPIWLVTSFYDNPYITRLMSDREIDKWISGRPTGMYYPMGGCSAIPVHSNQILSFAFIHTNQAQQAGLLYYTGNYKDGADFMEYLTPPALSVNATARERVEFLYRKCKWYLFRPTKEVVWCPDPL